MAHPIIGPVDVLYHSGGALAGAVFVKRRIYKQSKPFDLQLPYNAIYRYTLSASVTSSGTLSGLGSLAGISDPSTEGGGFTLYTDRLGYDSPETQQVLAKAHAKFFGPSRAFSRDAGELDRSTPITIDDHASLYGPFKVRKSVQETRRERRETGSHRGTFLKV